MGLLHKLKVWLKRTFSGNSIDYVSKQKSYGSEAEDDFLDALKEALPEATIKHNIMVETDKGRCEIDTLVRYKNKIFIIEIKHWKGVLIEEEGYFISKKEDKYTYETHTKKIKSPFNQVKRQTYLLKEMTKSNAWFNTIVYFCDADKVDASDENTWFVDFNELVKYIKNDGRSSYPDQIEKCLLNCKTADYIYSLSFWGEKNLHCIIEPSSLVFNCSDRKVCKTDIKRIKITHHFTYDDIMIELRKGGIATTTIEDGFIRVLDGGSLQSYSLSKIEWIIIGD